MTSLPTLPTATAAVVAELDAAERGVVLGLLVAGEAPRADGDGDRDRDRDSDGAAAAIAPPSGPRCAQAVRAIAALPRSERVELMGLLAREALAPIPAGIEHVHPDTLREVLAGESAETIALVTADVPAGVAADVVADLQRAVFASIVAVPALDPAARPTRWARWLLTLAPTALLAELTTAGAALLGASLRGADPEILRRAAAHFEAEWSDRIISAAQATAEPAADPAAEPAAEPAGDARTISREHARTLVAAVPPSPDPRRTLVLLGACAVGDRLGREDPNLVVAVAQRLPSDLSRQLLAALQM